MGSKFNFGNIGSGLLSEVSKEIRDHEKNDMTIVRLPLDDIDRNENNKQSINDIEELAESIRTGGLRQPIEVLKMPNGRYKLTAGERRYSAFVLLRDENPAYSTIPATITNVASVDLPISDALKEKYIIAVTNMERRNETDADRYDLFQIYKEVFTEARKNGYEVKGRVRDLIAERMNISPRQIGKMEYIEAHAPEELIHDIKTGNININQAEETSKQLEQEKTKLKKTKKAKTIDMLTAETYDITSDLFKSTYGFDDYFTVDHIEITKKQYAAILDSIATMEKEKRKIEKILAVAAGEN